MTQKNQTEKEAIKLYTPDNNELVSIELIEQDDNVLLLKCIIMGSIPMRAHVRPEEVRKFIKLLDFRTLLFILTLPFRRQSKLE